MFLKQINPNLAQAFLGCYIQSGVKQQLMLQKNKSRKWLLKKNVYI